MNSKIKHAVDNFWNTQNRPPNYICLGKLEIEELRKYIEEYYYKNSFEPIKTISTVEVKFGSYYGVRILPVDRDTFFEVL